MIKMKIPKKKAQKLDFSPDIYAKEWPSLARHTQIQTLTIIRVISSNNVPRNS